jgi:hypothetical protein
MDCVCWLRFCAGIVVCGLAAVGLVLLLFGKGDAAVAAALGLTGLFILAHWLITARWDFIMTMDRRLRLDEPGLLALAGAFITAPGAILAITSVFGATSASGTTTSFPIAVKVGLLALVAELLTSFILFGLVVAEKPEKPDRLILRMRPGPFIMLGPVRRFKPALVKEAVDAHEEVAPRVVDDRMTAFRAYLFNLALWAYAFGLLCIALGRVLN